VAEYSAALFRRSSPLGFIVCGKMASGEGRPSISALGSALAALRYLLLGTCVASGEDARRSRLGLCFGCAPMLTYKKYAALRSRA
jgi:hypothetical protein